MGDAWLIPRTGRDGPANGRRAAEIEAISTAEYPTAVGGYLEPLGRVIDVCFGALAQALPDRTPAASFGSVST